MPRIVLGCQGSSLSVGVCPCSLCVMCCYWAGLLLVVPCCHVVVVGCPRSPPVARGCRLPVVVRVCVCVFDCAHPSRCHWHVSVVSARPWLVSVMFTALGAGCMCHWLAVLVLDYARSCLVCLGMYAGVFDDVGWSPFHWLWLGVTVRPVLAVFVIR